MFLSNPLKFKWFSFPHLQLLKQLPSLQIFLLTGEQLWPIITYFICSSGLRPMLMKIEQAKQKNKMGKVSPKHMIRFSFASQIQINHQSLPSAYRPDNRRQIILGSVPYILFIFQTGLHLTFSLEKCHFSNPGMKLKFLTLSQNVNWRPTKNLPSRTPRITHLARWQLHKLEGLEPK